MVFLLYSMASTRVCFVMLFSGLEMLSKRWGTASRLGKGYTTAFSPTQTARSAPKSLSTRATDAELFREQSGLQQPRAACVCQCRQDLEIGSTGGTRSFCIGLQLLVAPSPSEEKLRQGPLYMTFGKCYHGETPFPGTSSGKLNTWGRYIKGFPESSPFPNFYKSFLEFLTKTTIH